MSKSLFARIAGWARDAARERGADADTADNAAAYAMTYAYEDAQVRGGHANEFVEKYLARSRGASYAEIVKGDE